MTVCWKGSPALSKSLTVASAMGAVPSVTVPYTVARTLGAGGEGQVDVLLLETLKGEAGAILKT